MLEYEVAEGVARIVMCNPPVNALSRAWGERFFAVLDALEARGDWTVLVVASDQKVFSAGGDIKQYADRIDRDDAGDLLAGEAAFFQKLFARVSALPQVSIAEIAGVAAGGGMELALACDLRVVSESTKVGLPEVGVGLLPAAGGTQRMTRLCGPGVALRLIGGAELVSGREALSLGLVEWAVPASEVRVRSDEIARRLADQPPEALRAAKACIAAAGSADGFGLELTYPPQLMRTSATKQRIRDFIGKQK
jgi:enoyl-CoA hydratase